MSHTHPCSRCQEYSCSGTDYHECQRARERHERGCVNEVGESNLVNEIGVEGVD
jgi:hypothetical protein